MKKRLLKSNPIRIFTFQYLKIKVILVMVCFVNLNKRTQKNQLVYFYIKLFK